MWMRVKRVKPTKLAIEKKQETISQSINVSEVTKQNLVKENEDLLVDISYKKEYILDIDKETENHVTKNEKAKEDYSKSKTKLDDLNASISDLGAMNKKNLEALETFTRAYEQEKELLIESNKKEETRLNKQIDNLKSNVDWLNSDKNSLTTSIEWLWNTRTHVLEKIIDKEKDLAYKQKEVNKLNKLNKQVEKDLANNIRSKNSLEFEIDTIRETRDSEKKELSIVTERLKEASVLLRDAQKAEMSAREKAVALVKKEENIAELTSKLKDLYWKAGITNINI